MVFSKFCMRRKRSSNGYDLGVCLIYRTKGKLTVQACFRLNSADKPHPTYRSCLRERLPTSLLDFIRIVNPHKTCTIRYRNTPNLLGSSYNVPLYPHHCSWSLVQAFFHLSPWIAHQSERQCVVFHWG